MAHLLWRKYLCVWACFDSPFGAQSAAHTATALQCTIQYFLHPCLSETRARAIFYAHFDAHSVTHAAAALQCIKLYYLLSPPSLSKISALALIMPVSGAATHQTVLLTHSLYRQNHVCGHSFTPASMPRARRMWQRAAARRETVLFSHVPCRKHVLPCSCFGTNLQPKSCRIWRWR